MDRLAAVAAFVTSGAYYGALGSRLVQLSPAFAGPGRPVAATAAVELVRNVVLALVIAWLADGDVPVVVLALALWIAFPAVLLAGSVFHERVPVPLAAIHAGDWLIKLVLITGIVGLWTA